MKTDTTYPNFHYSSDELKKFTCAGSLFSIMLLNEDRIIHVEMKDNTNLFRKWLLDNSIEDISPKYSKVI